MNRGKTGYEGEEWRGAEVPAPGDWVLNWVEGDVISWYHGDTKEDAPHAHLFAKYDGGFEPVAHELQFDGETVTIDHDPKPAIVMSRVAKALADREPSD